MAEPGSSQVSADLLYAAVKQIGTERVIEALIDLNAEEKRAR